MTSEKTEAAQQHRNLLRIEQELDKQIAQMQKLKATTRRHIEDIERRCDFKPTGSSFPLPSGFFESEIDNTLEK